MQIVFGVGIPRCKKEIFLEQSAQVLCSSWCAAEGGAPEEAAGMTAEDLADNVAQRGLSALRKKKE
jgi:hypothetical protein